MGITIMIVAPHTVRSSPTPYNQLLLGYGKSHQGWGMTTERVETADIAWQHCRPMFEVDKTWIKGTHEFWIELPFSLLLSDSDRDDSDDIGIVALNFLFAWIFPQSPIGELYLMGGGGPVYMLANIDGVGSDLCGNYQAGIGLRLPPIAEQTISLECRYHHISNLDMATPNVSLNSTKILIGVSLPF